MYEPSIQRTLKDLTNNKCKIFHEIDATKLNIADTLNIIDPELKKYINPFSTKQIRFIHKKRYIHMRTSWNW